MDTLEQALAALEQFLGTGGPASVGATGPNPPTTGLLGSGGSMSGAGYLPELLKFLVSSGGAVAGGATGANPLQTILQLITALGGGQYGSDQLNALQTIYKQQQHAAALAMNPSAMAQRTLAGTLPLNRQLQYNLTQQGEAAAANAGMAQSPGAVASAVSREFAPYAEQNLQLGQQNAQFGFPYAFGVQSPDYISVLNELNTLGKNSGGGAYSLPTP